MQSVYSGYLKMSDKFEKGNLVSKMCKIAYRLDTDYSVLLEKYRLNEIAGEGTDYDRARRVLSWEAEHIVHEAKYDGHVQNTAMSLFEYAFDTGAGINSRSMSLALTECLLAIGLKSRVIYMYPGSPYQCDNHVVCEVWMKELNKWVMIDPTYDSVVLDKNDTPLNILEIRTALADLEPLHLAEGFHYNGQAVAEDDILQHYAKNMFWFNVFTIQGCIEENTPYILPITIAPKGYDAKRFLLGNIEYRIQRWGAKKAYLDWKKGIENGERIYRDFSILYGK